MKQEKKAIQYNLRLPAKLKSQLEKRAKEERRSLNTWIVLCLEARIGQQTVEAR